MLGYDNGCVLRNVPTGFLGTLLNDETAKTPEIYGFSSFQGALDFLHEGFHYGLYIGPLQYKEALKVRENKMKELQEAIDLITENQ